MQTQLPATLRATAEGAEAERILRQCVHCGFCNATCPTYRLVGDELDGPRGRIYLIKQLLETGEGAEQTREHLDRCLTCRACETTCPAGVPYAKLAHIGRQLARDRAPRSAFERARRAVLRSLLLHRTIFAGAVAAARALRTCMPRAWTATIPLRGAARPIPTRTHRRRMVLLDGCVQPALLPNVNVATRRVLDALGIESLVAAEVECCGAIELHTDDESAGIARAKRNVDTWSKLVDQGVEAFVITASGCGVTVKDYGHLLRDEPAYAERAARIATMTRDIAEVLIAERPALEALRASIDGEDVGSVAFHSPCTLQHGQRLQGVPESLLRALGVDVRTPADANLCCGSAGTYAVLQPDMSRALRDRKLAALSATHGASIASANVGCICHLASGTSTPVAHWIELVDRMICR